MTGEEALTDIIEALKSHHRKNPDVYPKALRLPWGMAYDLAKLGRVELGELADKMITEGLGALEKQGFKGLAVVINWKDQYGDVLAT